MMHPLLRKAQADDEAILAALASIDVKIRKAFADFIKSLKDDAVVNQILAYLNDGRISDAMNIIQQQTETFSSKVISFYTIAGHQAAQTLSNLMGITIGFNQVNTRAVAVMQNTRLRLIREFTQEQEAVIRDLLTRGITEGTNPKITASQLKEVLGLTRRQWEAVNNFERLLEQNSAEVLTRALRDGRFDPTIQNALNSNTALTKDQIQRMVDRYAERQLDFRSKTIAQTESLRAVNQASQEAFEQAVESGSIDEDELIQTWITAGDERVRSSHAAMHGQQRKLGEPFMSGNGNELMYPGDPDAPASEVVRCRCVLTFRLTNPQEN